jgi:hypothetical protein
MGPIVLVDNIVLGLLGLLLVGLLRSHAEILRRLAESESQSTRSLPSPNGSSAPATTRVAPYLPQPRDGSDAASEVVGETLDGRAMKITVQGENKLLAFLSSGCLACQPFWKGLHSGEDKDLPGGARLVVLTKDSAYESPSRLRELAPSGTSLIMSSTAWEDYKIETAPYFIYIDGNEARVMSEGAASSWHQVASLLRDAIGDQEYARRLP